MFWSGAGPWEEAIEASGSCPWVRLRPSRWRTGAGAAVVGLRVSGGDPAGRQGGAVFFGQPFCQPGPDAYQAQLEDTVHSHERYETMERAFAQRKTWTAGQIQSLLAGEMGFMCQYDRSLGMDTVWSSLYDLKNGVILRAEGNPALSICPGRVALAGVLGAGASL